MSADNAVGRPSVASLNPDCKIEAALGDVSRRACFPPHIEAAP